MVRIWRGQGDIDWPLHSTAYRLLTNRPRSCSKSVTERDVSWYERDLLNRATHKGFRLYKGYELSDFELLARLRHHGAATRFIDATGNAFVALWFSAADKPDTPGLLMGIHCDYLGGSESQLEKRPYEVIMKKELPTTHALVWEPPHVTVRVAAQHSQFLWSPVISDITGSLALDKREGVNLFIAINPNLKEECLKILAEVFDIRRTTLFPDLDGFGIVNGVMYDPYSSYRW